MYVCTVHVLISWPAVTGRWVERLQKAVARAKKAYAKEKIETAASAVNVVQKLNSGIRRQRPKRCGTVWFWDCTSNHAGYAGACLAAFV